MADETYQEHIERLRSERQREAWRLVNKRGWTTRQAAEHLGTSHAQVQRDVATVEDLLNAELPSRRPQPSEPGPAVSKMSEPAEPANDEMLAAIVEGRKFT